MKKRWILPLLAALLTLTAGCSAPKVPVPNSADHVDLSPEEDVVLSGTVLREETAWDYRITTYTVTGEHCASNDPRRVLTRHSYQLPSMEVLPAAEEKAVPPEAEEAAREFNAYFEQVLREETAWFDEMALSADEDYRTVGHQADSLWQDREFHYSDEAVLDFWGNEHVVSVTTTRKSYAGGAHPTVWRSCATFDVSTGKQVLLAEMARDVSTLQETVTRELLRQAAERQRATAAEERLIYYEDYQETLQAWMERAVCFDDQGMTVIFGVYDLAPYAAGEQVFRIPYELLAPCLNAYGKTVLELH
ncbi:MAG: DUF3298 domain-containing protein [Oscillospiraceae bacterium]|nr:DUF3298 domain-containing protein [Oscillospiraceae bacterium]